MPSPPPCFPICPATFQWTLAPSLVASPVHSPTLAPVGRKATFLESYLDHGPPRLWEFVAAPPPPPPPHSLNRYTGGGGGSYRNQLRHGARCLGDTTDSNHSSHAMAACTQDTWAYRRSSPSVAFGRGMNVISEWANAQISQGLGREVAEKGPKGMFLFTFN